jgi:anti-sigma B factor antagonist
VEVTPFDFRIKVEELDGRTVLSVAGDVDLATSPIVLNRVEGLFRESVTTIALDLGAVTFLDSSGLAALLRAHTLAVEHDVPFTFASVSSEVRRVVRGAGLADVLGIDP